MDKIICVKIYYPTDYHTINVNDLGFFESEINYRYIIFNGNKFSIYKHDFEKHFMYLDEYREIKLNKILNG